ncbi:TPA: hypothetical protein N0F65_004442 [Lagenidium giganteum]|uniref:Uncharacterized protein n=1 Tax=Lagenidium giganteum TaxID=4803 RepID=A0AAV2ZP01_9STRA|nr:TPA: hypothetical protein N0F65_004442 [Lagenidium giganteum]
MIPPVTTALSSPASASASTSSSTSVSTPSATGSCATAVVTVVEKSILRTLAFVLYQMDRDQARFCASSILQVYSQLHTQLPLFAADSLEKFAGSFVSLSDAEFASYWSSLLEKDLEDARQHRKCSFARRTSKSKIAALPKEPERECDALDDCRGSGNGDCNNTSTDTLMKRVYQRVLCQIQQFFIRSLPDMWHTQTPLTSPDDKNDDSHFQPTRVTSRLHEHSDGNSTTTNGRRYELEPGWAIQYMQQESRVPSEMTRRMHKMMHSAIPLNLFRVEVMYGLDAPDNEYDGDGFIGVISPESFPPTPITRDIQTRRMNKYTVTILDHTTLALRLLQAQCSA